MSDNFENIPQLVKNQQDAVKTTVETFPKAGQRISAETADYSKQYFKNWSDFAEKLRGVTTFDEAIKLQTEFAKSSYESFVAQSTKMFELFTSLGKEAYQPIETNLTRATDLAKAQVEAVTDAATKAPFKSGANAR